jgi:hypothetical protein
MQACLDQPFTQQGQGHGQLSNRLEQRQSNSDGEFKILIY